MRRKERETRLTTTCSSTTPAHSWAKVLLSTVPEETQIGNPVASEWQERLEDLFVGGVGGGIRS